MTREELDETVRGYLAYLRDVRLPEIPPASREEAMALMEALRQRSDESEYSDAWEDVDDLIDSDPENAWNVLIESISRCDRGDLGMLGAGCLETFMWRRGVEFLDRVLSEIRANARFREAFRSVYLGQDFPELQGRIINSTLAESGVPPQSIIDWWTSAGDA